jgi:hypothetical protein
VGFLGFVSEHLVDSPLHVRTQRCPELPVVRQSGVVSRRNEALHASATQIGHVPVTRVHLQHAGVTAAALRVPRRATDDLLPVRRQPLDMAFEADVGCG